MIADVPRRSRPELICLVELRPSSLSQEGGTHLEQVCEGKLRGFELLSLLGAVVGLGVDPLVQDLHRHADAVERKRDLASYIQRAREREQMRCEVAWKGAARRGVAWRVAGAARRLLHYMLHYLLHECVTWYSDA